MQIEKALLNDRLRVWEVSWKFYILTIYNFTVIYLWNLLFSLKVAYFLTVSVVFSVCELSNLKTRTAMNANVSVFVISVEAIICFWLYNLHDWTRTYFSVDYIKLLISIYSSTYKPPRVVGSLTSDRSSARKAYQKP